MSPTELSQRQQHERQLIEDFRLTQVQSAVQETHDYTQTHYGEDSIEHAQSLINLGNWHENSGDYAASETLLKQAVQILRRHNTTGSLNAELADALHQLGGTYAKLARFEEAKNVHEEALALYQTFTNGEYDRKIPLLLNDLAGDYSHTGQPEKALEFYEQSAAQHEQLFGMAHRDTALAYTNLAIMYRRQGHRAEALSILKSTTQILQDLLGDHPRTVFAWTALATSHDEMQQYQEAAKIYPQATQMLLRCVGKDHPIHAHILFCQAKHYAQQHQFQAALPLLHQALTIAMNVFDENHPVMHSIIQNIVVLTLMHEQDLDFLDTED